MYIIKVQRTNRSIIHGTKGELWISDSNGKKPWFHSYTREPYKRHKPNSIDYRRIRAGSYEIGFLNTNQIPDEYYHPGQKPTDTGYLFEILIKDRDDCFIVEPEHAGRFRFPMLEIIPPPEHQRQQEYIPLWGIMVGLMNDAPDTDWRIRFRDEPEEKVTITVA